MALPKVLFKVSQSMSSHEGSVRLPLGIRTRLAPTDLATVKF
ncbi:hypothetical protein [Chamaesiphon polymorphus]|nr:hypothetical protein [Chamaesiphon polymorphus]